MLIESIGIMELILTALSSSVALESTPRNEDEVTIRLQQGSYSESKVSSVS